MSFLIEKSDKTHSDILFSPLQCARCALTLERSLLVKQWESIKTCQYTSISQQPRSIHPTGLYAFLQTQAIASEGLSTR